MIEKYAIYFPQFHQVSVNDEAWGVGFTDWFLIGNANAFDYWKKRAPLKGYYDLNDPGIVENQFEEASRYGLNGFAIYHYWFDTGGELGSVENYLFKNKPPDDFKYFFIWANEDWTKRWAGMDSDIIRKISRSPSDDEIKRHVEYLLPFFQSDSYSRHNGKPMFMFYRSDVYDNPSDVINRYIKTFLGLGVDVALGLVIKRPADVSELTGFDFCYLFEPRLYQNFYGIRKSRFVNVLYRFVSKFMKGSSVENISRYISTTLNHGDVKGFFSNYTKYMLSGERLRFFLNIKIDCQNVISCGWNNAPRYRDRAVNLVDVPTQIDFSDFLIKLNSTYPSSDLPILCNAWNEWSEGAALEPCYYNGDYLLKEYVKP